MHDILERVRQEPVLVTAFVAAACALLIAFGVPITPDQVGAILGLISAGLAFVVRPKTRSKRSLELEGYDG